MSNNEFLLNGRKYSVSGLKQSRFTPRKGKQPPSLYLDWGSHDLLVTGEQALSLNRTLFKH